MSKTIHAIYENGVFRPLGPVDLPERTAVEFKVRVAAIAPETGVDVVQGGVHRTPTTDELLAPFRRQVEESGMTDDELDKLFEEVRDEVWRAKHGSRP